MRTVDVSINTVAQLMVDAGKACAAFDDKKVRGVTARGWVRVFKVSGI